MKANETPEKIYLQVCGDCHQTDCESCKFEDFEDNITWCKDRIFPKDIEYTRTDTFIEKAKQWFIEHTNISQEIETNEDGEPLADSYIKYAKARFDAANEMFENFKTYIE